ncbi:MFS transporter [Saccharothrix sp. S26]|uniref:MFS transporter n=1 Tax=Saccharothrix sp. S26 TaxID=2907215 RepID=UPI001F208A03|nr:MFS transporter [Saccharothrix sp. S26]MCE6997367.1 MFS transporter [Saccharothrix sp. S26]
MAALRVRDFRLLWAARTVSVFGTWLLVVAVPAHVFHLTGSVMAAGAALAAEFLPPVLLGPVAGVLVDRWDRRRLMVAADVLRAAAVLLLLSARDPGDLWLVYVALVVESTGTVVFRPAAQAHTPVAVGTGTALSGANALNSLTDGVARLVGAPLGGALMALVGFPALVVADAASYLLSAALIAAMSRREGGDKGGGVREDLAAGLAFLRSERTARSLLVVSTVFLAANASLSALLVPFGLTTLGGAGPVGLVMSGLGVGFLLGAPVSRVLVDRLRSGPLLATALAVTAVGFVLLFASTSLTSALPSAVVIGLAGSTALVVTQTTLQRVTPTDVLGRVGAVLFTGEAAATFVGALAGPALAELTSTRTTAYVACAVTVVAAAYATSTPSVHQPFAR